MWETLLFKTKLLLCGSRVLLHSSEPTRRQTQAHRCHRAKQRMDHKGLLLCPVWKASLRTCSHTKALDIHVSPGSRWFEFLIKKGVFIAIQRLRGSRMWQSLTESLMCLLYAGPGWPLANVALHLYLDFNYFTDLSIPTPGFLLWQTTWAQATLPCPVCPRRFE